MMVAGVEEGQFRGPLVVLAPYSSISTQLSPPPASTRAASTRTLPRSCRRVGRCGIANRGHH